MSAPALDFPIAAESQDANDDLYIAMQMIRTAQDAIDGGGQLDPNSAAAISSTLGAALDMMQPILRFLTDAEGLQAGYAAARRRLIMEGWTAKQPKTSPMVAAAEIKKAAPGNRGGSFT